MKEAIVDARAARSARTLLRHPGELTLACTSGLRKPYVAPFQLEQYEPLFNRAVVLNAKSLILLKAIVLAFVAAAIVLGYRFALFFITLYAS